MIRLLLDSGAFSVWSRGLEVPLKDYIKYCQENKEAIWRPVVLDVIPGKPGKQGSAEEVDLAAKASAQNLKIMRKEGLNPLPVFHQGERFYWLEKMLDEGVDYLCLSAHKTYNTTQKMKFFDECFDFLCGLKGYPPVQLHCLGDTSWRILSRYPWKSVDSASWVLVGGMGKLIVPPKTQDGKWDWNATPNQVPISEGLNGVSSKMAWNYGKDFRTMGKRARAYLEEYCAWLGFSIKDLSKSNELRNYANARYYKMVGDNYIQPKWNRARPMFFLPEGGKKERGESKWKFEKGLYFFLCLSPSSMGQLRVMKKEKVKNQLISYAYLMAAKKFNLKDHASGRLKLTPPKEKVIPWTE